MTTADYQWGLSNPGPDSLRVVLEPWCDRFEVPARSTITLKAPGEFEEGVPLEVEWSPRWLEVWGKGPMVEVFIDGVLQESHSAVNAIPEWVIKKIALRQVLRQPSARLGEAFGLSARFDPTLRPAFHGGGSAGGVYSIFAISVLLAARAGRGNNACSSIAWVSAMEP